MRRSSYVRILQWTVSIGSLAVVLFTVNYSAFLINLNTIHLEYLMMGFLLAFSQFFIGAWRWRQIIILISDISVSTLELFRIYLISFFASYFMPGTITSDIYRMYDTRKMAGGSTKSSLVVIFERALSLIVLIAWSAIAWVCLRNKPAIYIPEGKIIVAVAFLLLLTTLIIWLVSKVKINIFQRIRKWLTDVGQLALNIPNLIWNNPFRMLEIIVGSFIYQMTALLIVFFALRAANVEIGVLEFFVIGSIVSLVIILPISVQGIGIREFLYLSLLSQYGIQSENLVAGLALTYLIGLPFVFWGWLLFTKRATGTKPGIIMK